MKVLITGATGFIGNHIIKELLKDKTIEIIATSRNIDKAQKYDWFDYITYIPFDMENITDNDLFEFFKKPDYLIHLAWDGLPNYKDLIHIEKNLFNNYNFLKNLIQNGLQNMSIIGTCFEYGMIDGCLSEDMTPQPSNSYAIAKDSLRRFIKELTNEYKFNYKWIRLFYMYGEGQSPKSLLSLVDKAIENGEKSFNMSAGEQLRDYLHISDVAKNIILLSRQEFYNNQIINCCSGQPISIRSLVENYLKEKNYTMKLNLGYYPYVDYESMAFWGNPIKLNYTKENIHE